MAYIKKVEASKGITWVEVPDAGLYLLCGCPSDSVKHLMRRGLIVPTEIDGTPCETGPNAILLSDIMLQNGQFSNMAEFPVLQMLYRQGMIIPGHPGNTGQRPLIVGAKEQVLAQMRYIYRGNYGLVSEEELQEAGLSHDEAHQMMRMKLKFAFGQIKPSNAFLDHCFVAQEPTEIRNGVMLKRLKVNLFELSYRDQSVQIDLNLGTDERFEPPYPLGLHNINRDYFGVVHCGDGDGWDPNRPCMGSILMYQGKIYLIDAGPNIERSLIALGIGLNEIEGIFHTHSHDDHFAGLASLIRADKRIKYYAAPLVRLSVVKKLSALLSMDESNFYHYFDVHNLACDQWNNMDGLEVMPLFSPHPVETTLFIFRTLWKDGYHSFAHFADTVAFSVLDGMVTEDPDALGISPELAAKVKQDYLYKADLKKIDIGGGMIHGQAMDFADDPSDRLMLCHTARPLTAQERKLGSGAPFGTSDTLIPAYQDYSLRLAWEFLSIHLPNAPTHALRMLLNNRTEVLNPEAIILRADDIPEYLYLVLTGTVETVHGETEITSNLYAGTVIGERSGLYKTPCHRTYRAASFVQALSIPTPLYREFIASNDMFQDIERLRDFRVFLDRTSLFNDGISYATRNHIAQHQETLTVARDHRFTDVDFNALYLIREGEVERYLGEELIETLGSGDFFGEELAFFQSHTLFTLRCTTDVTLHKIQKEALENIPIVRWKLYEAYQRQMHNIVQLDGDEEEIFQWRPSFNIGVEILDEQHRRLLGMGSTLYRAMLNSEQELVEQTLERLINFAYYHFHTEENYLVEIRSSLLAEHRALHRAMLGELKQFKHQATAPGFTNHEETFGFFKRWLLDHILREDIKFAPINR
uniref:Cyclic nucleotide-binding domain-containing protein n=1 Tax=Magnetococcus massalia (strain MO-1) TaxID=451514 RepID=A0A1S7LH19_MAGMO|nr:conserved protein of unknown function [Candidatus Magnetococcus massalia]